MHFAYRQENRARHRPRNSRGQVRDLVTANHPAGTFKEFDAPTLLSARLAARAGHNSLGPRIKKERVESAERAFHSLVALGVRPGDKFVDYGCGTLRLGVLFIEYLEPDHYFGLDIDERILTRGRGSTFART